MLLLSKLENFADRQRLKAAQYIANEQYHGAEMRAGLALLSRLLIQEQLESEQIVRFYWRTKNDQCQIAPSADGFPKIKEDWYKENRDYRPVSEATAYASVVAETFKNLTPNSPSYLAERVLAKDPHALEQDTVRMPLREAQVNMYYATHFILDRLYPVDLPEERVEERQANQEQQNRTLTQLNALPTSLENMKSNQPDRTLTIPVSEYYDLTITFIPQSTHKRTRDTGYVSKEWIYDHAFLRFSVNFKKDKAAPAGTIINARKEHANKAIDAENFARAVADGAQYIDQLDITKEFAIQSYRPASTWLKHELAHGWGVNTATAEQATNEMAGLIEMKTVRRLSELDAQDFAEKIGTLALPKTIAHKDILVLGNTFLAVITDNPTRTEQLSKPERCHLYLCPIGNLRKEVAAEYDVAFLKAAQELADKLMKQARFSRPYTDQTEVSRYDYENLTNYLPTMNGSALIAEARKIIAKQRPKGISHFLKMAELHFKKNGGYPHGGEDYPEEEKNRCWQVAYSYNGEGAPLGYVVKMWNY
jgi:hypothetical protein